MNIWKKSGILLVALMAFGAARIPFEVGLQKELRQAGLFQQKLEISTWDHVDQTRAAVALGGLRTLVATFLNLRAFTYFTEQKWAWVSKTFDAIVDLAPRTRYYWETGSWHMSYNAASYFMNDSKLPPLRRRESWRSSIVQGRSFLERGIRNNPQDWSLHASLGFLLSDPNKFPAFRDPKASFSAAADAYQAAAATGKAIGYVRRAHLYALARVEGREAEALALARSLFAEGKQNHTPTLLILLLVLEAYENPSLDVTARSIELFGTAEAAHEALSGHWQRTRERFPVHGVSKALEGLEKILNTPADKSIFSQPPPPPFNPEDFFQK